MGRIRDIVFSKAEIEALASMSDLTKVRNHLIRYGSITDAEARHYYGISRLSSVIFRLRNKQHPLMDIVTEMNYDEKDRFGQPSQYGRYYLKGVEDIEK